jgi:hypothetical protein
VGPGETLESPWPVGHSLLYAHEIYCNLKVCSYSVGKHLWPGSHGGLPSVGGLGETSKIPYKFDLKNEDILVDDSTLRKTAGSKAFFLYM